MTSRPSFPDIGAIIVMGISGSGKSTVGAALAERIGFRFADGDDFHPAANIAKMSAGIPLTDEDRWPWLSIISEIIARKIAAGDPIVIACSALKRSYREALLRGQYKARVVYLDLPRDILAERLSRRAHHFMPLALLDSQLAALEPPAPDENVISIDASGSLDKTVASIIAALEQDSLS